MAATRDTHAPQGLELSERGGFDSTQKEVGGKRDEWRQKIMANLVI
jgi:hypothetical protein